MSFARRIFDQETIDKLLGPGLWALAIKVSGAALSYVMFVVFARVLSGPDYGYFGLGFNLSILLSTVCGFGLATGIMRFWPEHITLKKFDLARGVVVFGLRAISLGAFVLLVLALLASVLGVGSAYLGAWSAPFAIAALAAASAFSDFAAGLLRAQGHVVWAMFPRDIVWRIAAPVAAIALAAAGLQVDGILALHICTIILIGLLVLQVGKLNRAAKLQSENAVPAFDVAQWRKRLLPVWASSVLYAMIQQLDVVMVGVLASPVEAGQYFAAQKTASLLGLVMLAGGLVGAPLMAANYHSGKLRELQKLCSILAVAIALTTAVGLLVLIVFGEPLLGLFDPKFTQAYGVLMVLAVGYTIDSLAGPNGYLMQMTSLEGPYLKIMAGCYAGVLLAQLILVPRYGGLGAAVASAGGIIAWNVCAIWLLRSRKQLDPSVLGLIFKTKNG